MATIAACAYVIPFLLTLPSSHLLFLFLPPTLPLSPSMTSFLSHTGLLRVVRADVSSGLQLPWHIQMTASRSTPSHSPDLPVFPALLLCYPLDFRQGGRATPIRTELYIVRRVVTGRRGILEPWLPLIFHNIHSSEREEKEYMSYFLYDFNK